MPVAPGAMPHDSVRGQQTTLSGLQETSLPRLHVNIAHLYVRIQARKDSGKRRRIWNHALEKALFTAQELETIGAPYRRTIHQASLEAHIDRMHAQLMSLGYYPVQYEKLAPFKGTNTKIAKSPGRLAARRGSAEAEAPRGRACGELEGSLIDTLCGEADDFRQHDNLRGQLEAIEAGPQAAAKHRAEMQAAKWN